MTEAAQLPKGGVWFVYDGDCPMCSMAAHALRIRQKYGPLHLVDARRDHDDPLLAEIKRRQMNLDEGMAIWCDGRFFHGESALRFMAQFSDNEGWLNRLNRMLFRSPSVARFSYPKLRAIRNLLLAIKGVSKLENLRDDEKPLFASVFGADWDGLPRVLQRHYANRAFRDDVVTVEGTLTVEFSPLGRALKPLMRWTKALVPYEGRDVPVKVAFVTDANSNAFRFERAFRFPSRPPYAFRSAMIPVGGDLLTEWMSGGLGWRTAYRWNGTKVTLTHRGYVARLFGLAIPVPLTLFLGAGYAEEEAIDDDSFSMWTEIRHPLWGRVFGYRGQFRVTRDR